MATKDILVVDDEVGIREFKQGIETVRMVRANAAKRIFERVCEFNVSLQANLQSSPFAMRQWQRCHFCKPGSTLMVRARRWAISAFEKS